MTLIKRIFTNGWQSLATLFSALPAVVIPTIPAALTAFAFIFTDMYYGYKVSKKYGKREIESSKVWKTINKLTEAASIIFLGALLDNFIFVEATELACARIAAGSVCVAEALSLLESFRALHPKAKLSLLLSKIIKSKAEKYLDVDMSDIIKEDTNNVNTDNTTKK